MGQYWSSSTPVERFVIPVPDHAKILINQAVCTLCRRLVRDQGVCVCGNVAVDGGTNELGRTVTNPLHYSNCNLIEYTGHA